MKQAEGQPRIYLATIALASFVLAFVLARVFSFLFPSLVLIGAGVHIHHFWFGIVFLAVGGWLGISYNHKEIDMAAAIIYGVGGGLIADEVGLLLTFGDYWSNLTWTFVIVLLAIASVLILVGKYRQSVLEELHEFVSSKASLFVGIFLAAVSVSFVVETNDFLVIAVSAVLTAVAIGIVLAFIIHRERKMSLN